MNKMSTESHQIIHVFFYLDYDKFSMFIIQIPQKLLSFI